MREVIKCKICDCDFEKVRWNSKYCGNECREKSKSGNTERAAQTVEGIYKRYMYSSKDRGYEFNLTLIYFENHWQSDCHYCGEKLKSVGFDRVDNSKGYIHDNVVPCCGGCNIMKRSLGYSEFIERCGVIYENHKNNL